MSARQFKRRIAAGLTLIELLLVLALLVVIGALTTPALDGAFSRAKLTNAADQLRAAWGRARLAAMQSGEMQLFRFELEGRRFQIIPLSAEGAPPPVEDAEADGADKNELPEGVVFYTGRLEPVEPVAGQPAVSPAATQTTPEGWSLPIRFYPDGGTSDAIVVLVGEQDLGVQVTLRGLTGVSAVSEAHPKEAFRL